MEIPEEKKTIEDHGYNNKWTHKTQHETTDTQANLQDSHRDTLKEKTA